MNACGVCRKQKLRCDGGTPACGRCARLGHQCTYDERRRKSGPRRGYVKGLETRLAEVEKLLKKYEPENESQKESATATANVIVDSNVETNQLPNSLITTYGISSFSHSSRHGFSDIHQPNAPDTLDDEKPDDLGGSFSWEMVELGLEEPLPLQEILDDLTQIYFAKIQTSVPMIHQYRFLAALNLSPNARPPIALRYAMWTLAASITGRYQNLHEHLYARARKYAELAEMTGHGEKVTNARYTQAWILLGIYELKMMYFPRAWLSTGRAVRLAQMMGMHRLDGHSFDLKQTLMPPRDWVEKEERRRTFWMAFCMDRFATIGTGWPMAIEEPDIHTHLPCAEEAYEQGQETKASSLEDALRPSGAADLSPFAGVVVVATLFGRVILHLHRPGRDDRDDEPNGEFWKRHRDMDNMLLSTTLYLPPHLRLPVVSPKPNTIFLHMNLHAASICLHQVALFKAEKNQLPSDLISESGVRCFTAAAEITRIMRMIAHTDLSGMNPFLPFCVFVATRVFIHHVKRHPNDDDTMSSVRFLLSAMAVLQAMNPLAASFLVQLDVELEGTGLEAHPDEPRYQPRFEKSAAELEKVEIDGFAFYSVAPPRTQTVPQSEASGDRAAAAPAKKIDSGVSATSSSPKPQLSRDERSGETMQYQCLPFRKVAASNYRLSAHHEFQAQESLSSDSFSTLPTMNFDEVISGSTSELDLDADGIPRSSNTAMPHYSGFSTHSPSQVGSAPSPGVAPHFESGDYDRLGVHAAGYTSSTQSYMTQMPGSEEVNYVTEEAWDFGNANIPHDLYDTMMNAEHLG